MFSFFRRSASQPVSNAIARAIASQGLTRTLGDTARLRMVQLGGRYSNRKVTYFRIFDPAVASERMLNIQRYRDLDAFQNLVLRTGHIESDGQIVVNRPVAVRVVSTEQRTRAGRDVAPIAPTRQSGAEVNGSAVAAAIDTPESGPT